MRKIIHAIIFLLKRLVWSKEKIARSLGVKIGKNCSIASLGFGSEPYLITIGNHVQITGDVKFFNHGGAWVIRDKDPKFDFFGKIEVGNNVYIGNAAMILPGVVIGDNVIIAANTVVTKSVDSNSIVAGNPGKVVGTVDSFYEKMEPFNLKSKGLKADQKRDFLLSLDENKFIRK